jgi:hypothetical protein
MPDLGKTMSKTAEPSVTDEATSVAGWKIRLSMLCAMPVLALAGMGTPQASESGSWELCLFIVLVYAALSLCRSWQSAKQSGQSVGKLGVPVAICIIRVVILHSPIPGIYEPGEAVASTQ